MLFSKRAWPGVVAPYVSAARIVTRYEIPKQMLKVWIKRYGLRGKGHR